MRIRTLISLGVVVSAVIIMSVGSGLWVTFRGIDEARRQQLIAQHVQEEVFDLNVLTGEYLFRGSARALAQWREKYVSIGDALADAESVPGVDASWLAALRADHGGVGNRFLRLEAAAGRFGEPGTADARQSELMQRLATHLFIGLRAMVTEARQWALATDKKAQRELVQAQWLLGLLVALLAVMIFAPWVVVANRMLPAFRGLEKGFEHVGQGDLKYRMGWTQRDELGDIARAFDAMTGSLERVTASRDALEREIAARVAAEATLRRAMADLERSNQELQQFAYIASHDLQEPLRMVNSYVQLLSRRYADTLDDEANEFIAFAVDGATRMQNLIDGLLSFSRVRTMGKDPEPVDSDRVLDGTLRLMARVIDDGGATITRDPLPQVMADEGQLGQVFQNLVSNAVKFRGETAPVIHVSGTSDGEFARFAVRDNGIGIGSDYADKVFQIFQRLHGRDKYDGTGIGLAVCKRIVERHNGQIWFESPPGEGTTFYFTMPLAQEERT